MGCEQVRFATNTRAKLSADEQYLMMLKEKCEMTDKEWAERTKTRQEEMKAVSETIEIGRASCRERV